MKALNKQEGGDHYKDQAIQPVEFIQKNNIGFMEGNVIKYVCRHHKKNGVEDINKAIHYLELLRDLQYPEKSDENQMEMEFFNEINKRVILRQDPEPIEISVEDLQVGDTFDYRLNRKTVGKIFKHRYTVYIHYVDHGVVTYNNGTKVILHERKEPREEPEQSR